MITVSQLHRHPWASLLFLVPLLAVYEGGVLWLGGDRADRLRNGADAWMRWGLDVFGAGHVLAAPLIVLVVHVDLDVVALGRPAGRPRHAVLRNGIRELSLRVPSVAVQPQLRTDRRRARRSSFRSRSRPPPLAQILTFIGAGIYEEVLFRLGLFVGLYGVLRVVHLPKLVAVSLAAVAAAAAFAAAHHVGPYGEPIRADYFVFRTAAGLYFTLSVRPARFRHRGGCACRLRRARRRERDVNDTARAGNARAGVQRVARINRRSLSCRPADVDDPVPNRVHALALELASSVTFARRHCECRRRLPGSVLDLGPNVDRDSPPRTIRGHCPGRSCRRPRSGRLACVFLRASTKAIN